MSDWPAPLQLYRWISGLGEPFAPWLLARRARRGKEDRARLAERLGRSAIPRPDGRLVWIHGVSVGESLSHLPLVERLDRERPEIKVLVTSGTRTSAELMARRLPPHVIHQYAPIDGPRAARRFIEHWRPNLGVFVESELWPNLLAAAQAQGTRLALLSARFSERSMRAWDRSPRAAHALLDMFDLIYAQDFETHGWIEEHGVAVAGRLDLKRFADPLPYDREAYDALRAAIGERVVVVAASTHAGEEVLIGEAVRDLDPRPLLILVPRHPERGSAVAFNLAARGWAVLRRSESDVVGPKTEAYIADTLGELGLFYRLADVAVMGGSFVEGLGGHNPLEPARLSRPIITGPHIDAFVEVYTDLIAEKAALLVKDERELSSALRALLDEPKLGQALGERARRPAPEVPPAGRCEHHGGGSRDCRLIHA